MYKDDIKDRLNDLTKMLLNERDELDEGFRIAYEKNDEHLSHHYDQLINENRGKINIIGAIVLMLPEYKVLDNE